MPIIAVALLAGLYLWSYGDCLDTFFSHDDYWVLEAVDRIQIRSPLDVVEFFRPVPSFLLYRPLSTLMYFGALRGLFGHAPTGYHAIQLSFHVLNAFLVYAIAGRLLHARSAGLAAALIYATAPGHAIAVYWIALFTVTGTAFLYLLALYLWIALPERRRVVLTYAVFVTALLAGEHAITLPIALTLTTLLLEDRPSWRAIVRTQGAFYILAVAYGGAKLAYIHFVLPREVSPIAYGFMTEHYGLRLTPAHVLRNVGKYVGYALPFVSQPFVDDDVTTLLAGSLVVIAAVGITTSVLIGRVTSWELRVAAFGAALFVAALAPVAVLNSHVVSCYIGIAALGMALAVIGVARTSPFPRAGPFLVAALFVIVHLTSSVERNLHSMQFKIFNGFSETTARWLYTIAEAATPETKEVVVPEGAIERSALEHDAQRVLLCGAYAVRTTKRPMFEKPMPGRIVLRKSLVLPDRGFARRDWTWMDRGCRR